MNNLELREKVANLISNSVHCESKSYPCKDCYDLADQILALIGKFCHKPIIKTLEQSYKENAEEDETNG